MDGKTELIKNFALFLDHKQGTHFHKLNQPLMIIKIKKENYLNVNPFYRLAYLFPGVPNAQNTYLIDTEGKIVESKLLVLPEKKYDSLYNKYNKKIITNTGSEEYEYGYRYSSLTSSPDFFNYFVGLNSNTFEYIARNIKINAPNSD